MNGAQHPLDEESLEPFLETSEDVKHKKKLLSNDRSESNMHGTSEKGANGRRGVDRVFCPHKSRGVSFRGRGRQRKKPTDGGENEERGVAEGNNRLRSIT